MQAPCCAGGGEGSRRCLRAGEGKTRCCMTGCGHSRPGPSKVGLDASCYSRRIYNHAATGRPILLQPEGSSPAPAGSVPLHPTLLKHPRYSPGASRSTPQHPHPGGRPVAMATTLPITTATPSGRHGNRPPRQPGPRPRRCHGRVPPPAAVAPEAPPRGGPAVTRRR